MRAVRVVIVATLLVGPGYFAEAMGHRPGDPMGAAMDEATRAACERAARTIDSDYHRGRTMDALHARGS